jgi:hypothetical protein
MIVMRERGQCFNAYRTNTAPLSGYVMMRAEIKKLKNPFAPVSVLATPIMGWVKLFPYNTFRLGYLL